MTRITIEQAAKMMDASPGFIRECMKADKLPIGVACRMPGGRWSFLIYREKVLNYLETGGSEV